jgi:hypothetical protein
MESGGFVRESDSPLILLRPQVDTAEVIVVRALLLLIGVGLLALGTWEFSLATDSTYSGDTVGFAVWIWVSGGSAFTAGIIGPRRRLWFWLLVVIFVVTAAVILYVIWYLFTYGID